MGDLLAQLLIMSILFGGIIYIIYYIVRWWTTDWCPEADFYRREADRLRKMKLKNEEEYNNYINRHDSYYRKILDIPDKIKKDKYK